MEEPDERRDGADGHQHLDPPRRPGAGAIREGHARRRRARWRRRPRRGDLAAARRTPRWPPARRPGRRPAAGSSAPGGPAGWPGGSPRRRLTASRRPLAAGPASPGRHRPGQPPARLAGRRRAPRPGPTAPGSRGAPVRRARAGRTTVPRARSATRSASSGSSGRSHGDSDRLGRRPLQLPHHQLAGVGGRAPVDEAPAVARRVRAGAPRAGPTSVRGRSPDLAGLLVAGSGDGRAGRPQTGRDVESDGSGSRTRRVHHCRANGAAEAMSSVTDVVHAAAPGTSVMRSPAVSRRPTGPTKTSGPGGSTGRTRRRVVASTRDVHRQAGDGVGRGAA